ncbi:MAG: S-layer homology domain-containing protein [Oscillospiraceae bacterium]
MEIVSADAGELEELPSYTFPAVTDDEARVKAIAEAVAAELGGEITALYQMADGLWYVVITVDGTIKGAVVQAVKSGGKLTYKVLERHDEPAAEETLQNLANDFRSKPNLTPDYAATEGFTTAKEYEDYLKKLLDNIPGGAPNDAAKGELAAFLENSVSRVSTVTVPAKENRVTLTGSDISAGCASAKETGDALQGVLTGTDVSLNKALTIIIRVECQGLDSGKPLQLDLDASLLDTLGDAELMLLLGDGSHAVRLTAADLRALINAYGVLSIQMEKTGDAAYTINFLNAEGELINWLCANVSFFLPASGPLATVLASYQGGSDNWGGQYDERTAAIRFSTPYSGVYEVMENDLAISDLDGVSEEQRAAVAFMVSKGYFTLDGEGAFRPGVSLKRYDFTKALVGMFFALEHDLSTTFTDVPADSPYRDVVASAQAKNLIKGYNETTFAGEDNISGEQVLTLAGRTLVERKGYSYPADPAQYLTFPGGAEVDDWAQEATALAVREGVLTPGESLSPLTDLSRADAALYLYRLFMLLYEVSPETIQMQTPPEKPAAPAIPVVPIVLGAGGVALVGVGAWLWLKRKKTDA